MKGLKYVAKVCRKICFRIFDKDSYGECSVAQDFIIFVFESTVKESEQGFSMWGDCFLQTRNNSSEASDGSGPITEGAILFLHQVYQCWNLRKIAIKHT